MLNSPPTASLGLQFGNYNVRYGGESTGLIPRRDDRYDTVQRPRRDLRASPPERSWTAVAKAARSGHEGPAPGSRLRRERCHDPSCVGCRAIGLQPLRTYPADGRVQSRPVTGEHRVGVRTARGPCG